MKPRVTLEFDGTTVYQIKGKLNNAPDEKWWPHITWFIENMGAESIEESGDGSKDVDGFR